MTLPVASNALLGNILGLEDVQAAARTLDGRIDIFCALALRRLRHGGAMVVVVCTCCGLLRGCVVCKWVEGCENYARFGLVWCGVARVLALGVSLIPP
jgi:hypothetical protein